ncbi:hypothetical protein EVAR_2919_1 [Eumeta japonica]|uniref:Uncharacterized protein n=1 Tax=Eumeta variegata TaxID=151549 RepID=A0A4C1T1R9_EUMVA|nr:hypothetical protein EVAR_2919_1 [Eumeta japonica]
MHEELGDRKPSQFLRHSQGLAEPDISKDLSQYGQAAYYKTFTLASSRQPRMGANNGNQPHNKNSPGDNISGKIYPISIQEAYNGLVTLVELRESMGGGEHLLLCLGLILTFIEAKSCSGLYEACPSGPSVITCACLL